ncbi:hypothetical protein BG015_007758 [Linnemannia schmuckeri]|uniref:Uncharacterized protein n=1 Tax=Linnemannia schmuckeri TaxID=64567 RepID=A0A9P5VAV2_9FUNG|nr:hypothetical protein BG015_007758 [Linnemannia schmuckeri]
MHLLHLHSFTMDFDSTVTTPDPIKTILLYCPNSVHDLYLTNLRSQSTRLATRNLVQLSRSVSAFLLDIISNIFSAIITIHIHVLNNNNSSSNNNILDNRNLILLTNHPKSPLPHIRMPQNKDQENLLLFPLLRQASKLERLKIDTTHHDRYHARLAVALSAHCPQIKSLELFHIEFTEQELFRLIDTFEGMDRFALYITPEMNRRAIPALVENSGHTVQSTFLPPSRVSHYHLYTNNNNSDCQQQDPHTRNSVPGTLPKSNTLEVQPDWASFNFGIRLRELVEIDWASRQLETLILSISEPEFASCNGMKPEKEFGHNLVTAPSHTSNNRNCNHDNYRSLENQEHQR